MTEIAGVSAEISVIAQDCSRLNTYIYEAVIALSKNDGQRAELKFLEFQKTLKELQVKVADTKRHLDELKSTKDE